MQIALTHFAPFAERWIDFVSDMSVFTFFAGNGYCQGSVGRGLSRFPALRICPWTPEHGRWSNSDEMLQQIYVYKIILPCFLGDHDN